MIGPCGALMDQPAVLVAADGHAQRIEGQAGEERRHRTGHAGVQVEQRPYRGRTGRHGKREQQHGAETADDQGVATQLLRSSPIPLRSDQSRQGERRRIDYHKDRHTDPDSGERLTSVVGSGFPVQGPSVTIAAVRQRITSARS
jgi:hypothetical protein